MTGAAEAARLHGRAALANKAASKQSRGAFSRATRAAQTRHSDRALNFHRYVFPMAVAEQG
jgi:hypothetical protein